MDETNPHSGTDLRDSGDIMRDLSDLNWVSVGWEETAAEEMGGGRPSDKLVEVALWVNLTPPEDLSILGSKLVRLAKPTAYSVSLDLHGAVRSTDYTTCTPLSATFQIELRLVQRTNPNVLLGTYPVVLGAWAESPDPQRRKVSNLDAGSLKAGAEKMGFGVSGESHAEVKTEYEEVVQSAVFFPGQPANPRTVTWECRKSGSAHGFEGLFRAVALIGTDELGSLEVISRAVVVAEESSSGFPRELRTTPLCARTRFEFRSSQ